MSRAFVVVLDACGVGALPDADAYGDAGVNTLGHLAAAAGGLRLPTLGRLGLGSIIDVLGVPPAENPVLHGSLHALGPGKDSTAGHWELMGVVARDPLPTYPDGFPAELIERVQAASGRGVLCNRPFNGIGAIEEFGRAARRDREADRVHQSGLGDAARRPRRRGQCARAVRDLHPGASVADR